MDTISIDDVKDLARVKEAAAVSIYLPTHLAPDARQDGIRLKNLLERAEDELASKGLRRADAKELLISAEKLPRDVEFWKCLSRGLAIFLTPKLFRAYRLPVEFGESVTIHHRLQIKPLLPVADRGERFLLLALSQNHVRLFDVTRFRINQVVVKGLPENKLQALNYDGVDRGEQVHEGMRGNLGKQAGVFHGQGGVKDTAKPDLTQFFQMIDRALSPMFQKETAPLLLAGVDYLLPLFRQTCTYSHLMERHLAGNCDMLSGAQLREKGWEIMRPYFDRPWRDGIQKFHALLGTGKASADVTEIAAASVTGKIETLFVDTRQEQWGRFDSSLGKAATCNRNYDGSEDLVNFAASEALLHGGDVFAVEPHELPPSAAMAASFRY